MICELDTPTPDPELEFKAIFNHTQCMPDRSFVQNNILFYLKWLVEWKAFFEKENLIMSPKNMRDFMKENGIIQ